MLEPKYKRARKVRQIILPIGPSIAYVPLTQGQFSLIDSEDATRLGEFNWFAHYDKSIRDHYAQTHHPYENGTSRSIKMHRLILEDNQPGLQVDHKNCSTLDNRRANLRWVTPSQNTQNRRAFRNTTSDGLKGVSWSKLHKSWRACINKDGVYHHIGLFKDKHDAHAAYVKKAHQLHGEFARTA